MKKLCIGVLGLAAAILASAVGAQENTATSPSHLGVTYIKYHLTKDALPVWNLEPPQDPVAPPRLTFKNGNIDEIDAYFEPALSNFTLGKLNHWQDQTPAVINAIKTNWSTEALSTGALWLKIAYDKIHQGQPENHLLRDEQHLLRGKLNLPLGESSFSLGAYIALYTANIENILADSPKAVRSLQSQLAESAPDAPTIAQAGFGTTAGAQGMTWPTQVPFATGVSNRNAFSGAVNVSGAVKGINVFTEVGFASGSGGVSEDSTAEPLNVTDFYALGGAKYKVGQVTLGVEAGFENGNDPIDGITGHLPGFENDFWSDRVIEDGIPGEQINNKLYAKVSAQMSPLQKINLEGALSCIKPMESVNGASVYGLQVNGALYYSFTKYVKYLIKAGVTSLMQNASLAGSQYKLMNRVEVKF